MASLDKYPVASAVELFYRLNDRIAKPMRDGRKAQDVEIHLSLDDARAFYAAMKHLELMDIQGVGFEQTAIPLRDCLKFIREKAEELRHQPDDGKVLVLDARGIKAMKFIERHLDHFAIIKEGDAKQKKRSFRR